MSQDSSKEQPKLLPKETVTKESGFDDDVEYPGPIGGEQPVTGLGEATGYGAAAPILNGEAVNYIKTFDQSHFPPNELHRETEEHSVEQTHGPESVFAEEADTFISSSRQEMVVSDRSTQVNKRRVSTSELSSSDESFDNLEHEVKKVRSKNKAKNKTIKNLKKELETSKESEANLKCEREEQKKENEQLEYELKQKEEEMEQMKHDHQVELQALETEVQQKDDEVQRVREQLAVTEKENEEQKRKLQDRIDMLQREQAAMKLHNEDAKQLYERELQKLEANLSIAKAEAKIKESELAELRVSVKAKDNENREKELQLREVIVELREKLQEMKTKEHELELKEARTQTELEKEKRRNSVSCSDVESLKKAHREELGKVHEQCEKERSNSVPKEEHEAVLEAQRSNSIPKEEHEATVKEKEGQIEELQNKLAHFEA